MNRIYLDPMNNFVPDYSKVEFEQAATAACGSITLEDLNNFSELDSVFFHPIDYLDVTSLMLAQKSDNKEIEPQIKDGVAAYFLGNVKFYITDFVAEGRVVGLSKDGTVKFTLEINRGR